MLYSLINFNNILFKSNRAINVKCYYIKNLLTNFCMLNV